MTNPKSFTIRVEEETLNKFRFVAKYDGRSLSGQITHLIHTNIREFEKEHGTIKLPDEDTQKRG